MSDNRTVDRIKVALHMSEPDTVMSPEDALQVLTLAQRTAENHITAATGHAQTVRSEAEAAAEQVRAEALSYAEKIRGEADTFLDEARAAADLRRHEADARAAEFRSQAAATLTDARTEAERIVAEGRDRAKQLDLGAQQRYDDAVGSLEVKREALCKQIEMLAILDADYRRRLSSFMQAQLRELWADQVEAGEMPEPEAQMSGGPLSSPEES